MRAHRRTEPSVREAIERDRLVAMVEMLFFAYRDFTGEADELLHELGLGRAHHRVLHFVARNPGLRVADLLRILRITKQSLARVLKQLVDRDYVLQEPGPIDRRERRLHLSARGEALAERLLVLQTRRIAAALATAGNDAMVPASAFLEAVIAEESRVEARQLMRLDVPGAAKAIASARNRDASGGG